MRPSTSSKRPAPLAQRLRAVERRLAALEGRPAAGAERTPRGAGTGALGLLRSLARQAAPPRPRKERSGTVAYVGVTWRGDEEHQGAREHAIAGLLEADWAGTAGLLECLGSAPRLALIGALLAGPADRRALQAALGEASTGQLYHHLRDLQAAGLLEQRRRGEYRLADHALVPLLAVLAAGLDLARGVPAATEPP